MTMTEHNNRLRWLCRRGMKELDLVITQFYDRIYATLDTDQQEAFYDFLHLEDPVIYSWIMGRTSPEDERFARIVKRLQNMFDKPIGS